MIPHRALNPFGGSQGPSRACVDTLGTKDIAARPILQNHRAKEFMARPQNSTLINSLPVLRQQAHGRLASRVDVRRSLKRAAIIMPYYA